MKNKKLFWGITIACVFLFSFLLTTQVVFAVGQQGEECSNLDPDNPNDVCISGLFCSEADTCEPQVGLNESCESYESCSQSGPIPLYCNNITNYCEAKVLGGDACMGLGETDKDFSCQSGDCLASGFCSCTNQDQCENGKYCNTSTKECKPVITAGNTCPGPGTCQEHFSCTKTDLSGGTDICSCHLSPATACTGNTFCDSDAGTCKVKLPKDAACTTTVDNDKCASGSCIQKPDQADANVGICTDPNAAPPEPTCDAHSKCTGTTYCDFGAADSTNKCAEKKKPGEECKLNNVRTDEMCISGDCGVTTAKCNCKDDSSCPAEQMCNLLKNCDDKAKAGETCTKNEDCISSTWCNTTQTPTKCEDRIASGFDCDKTKPAEQCVTGHKCEEKNVAIPPAAAEMKFICTCEANSCGDGKFCGGASSVCKEKYPEGADCITTNQSVCLSGKCEAIDAAVDPNKGKCTKPADPAAAASGSGGTPAITLQLPNFLGTVEPSVVIGRVIEFIIGLVGSAALIMFIYGGFQWLISAGREEYVTQGRDTMVWAAIGLALSFTSYIVVKFIITTLAGG
jgi:hypothetical protein